MTLRDRSGVEWLTHLAARYRRVHEPPEQIGEGRAKLGLYPTTGREVMAAESEESLQKATDFLVALHVLDEVGRDVEWDLNLGDGRM